MEQICMGWDRKRDGGPRGIFRCSIGVLSRLFFQYCRLMLEDIVLRIMRPGAGKGIPSGSSTGEDGALVVEPTAHLRRLY